MKQCFEEELAVKTLKDLISIIEEEYAFAVYSNRVYARNSDNFESEEVQQKYIFWSGGRLEAMRNLMEKTEEYDLINSETKMKGPV